MVALHHSTTAAGSRDHEHNPMLQATHLDSKGSEPSGMSSHRFLAARDIRRMDDPLLIFRHMS